MKKTFKYLQNVLKQFCLINNFISKKQKGVEKGAISFK